jgi:hypothetical protein
MMGAIPSLYENGTSPGQEPPPLSHAAEAEQQQQ